MMALHSVDKGNGQSPSPNKRDVLIPDSVQAHNTISTSYSLNANNLRLVFKNTLILTYDQNNNISSVYGYVPGASSTTPVLIIAQPGKDVFTDVLGISRPVGL